MKNRIREFDIIRPLCAIGIVLTHYAQAIDERISFHMYANGAWGGSIVTVFFILSGALLFYQHPAIPDLKRFYRRRWLAIFPAFYLAYLIFLLLGLCINPHLFDGISPATAFFTLLGLDGYLQPFGPNYYLLGEWFLGAIIILYLLYPFLLWIYQRHEYILLALLLLLNLRFLGTEYHGIPFFYSPITVLFSALLGMSFIRHRLYEQRWLPWLCLCGFLGLYRIPLPIEFQLGNLLSGICLFGTLFLLGHCLLKLPGIYPVCRAVSDISYEIFLTHHRIIVYLLALIIPQTPAQDNLLFLLVLAVTLAASKALAVVSRTLVRKISDALRRK